MQVVGRILPAMYYKSIKSQVGRLSTIFITNIGFSVTSRRGVSTSRRKFYMLLSCRDVDFPRRDVNFTFSVTSRRGSPTSRSQFSPSLSRRDVDLPRHDVNFHLLCHVATCIFTS